METATKASMRARHGRELEQDIRPPNRYPAGGDARRADAPDRVRTVLRRARHPGEGPAGEWPRPCRFSLSIVVAVKIRASPIEIWKKSSPSLAARWAVVE